MPRKGDSQQTSLALLTQRFDALQQSIDTGFAGVHQRQDTTNGKVLKAGDDIIALQKSDQDLKAQFEYNRIIWYMLTVAISVIVALASFILLNK